MINLKLTNEHYLERLYEIKKRAFEQEFETYGHRSDEIISIEWHQSMLTNSLYFSIFYDDILIGGVNLMSNRNESYYICSIFIEPGLQNRGFGKRAIDELEKKYPDWKTWVLETPSVSEKNIHFYKSCGYLVKNEFKVKGSNDFMLTVMEKRR